MILFIISYYNLFIMTNYYLLYFVIWALIVTNLVQEIVLKPFCRVLAGLRPLPFRPRSQRPGAQYDPNSSNLYFYYVNTYPLF